MGSLTESTTYTFDLRRNYDSENHVVGEKAETERFDLLSFLAVAQQLKIQYLPITYQTALEEIERGGTAQISQATLGRRKGLAFKRIKDKDKVERFRAYQMLTSELLVLGHPAVKHHPNIVKLLGICWDIPSDEEVWPALVFEKSEFGDLKRFVNFRNAQRMKILDRIELCADIGMALADMHSNSEICLALSFESG
jgi:serine/threonine protein kinase